MSFLPCIRPVSVIHSLKLTSDFCFVNIKILVEFHFIPYKGKINKKKHLTSTDMEFLFDV